MKTFALATLAGAVSAVSNIELKFINYLSAYGKQHASVEEFITRLEYFAANNGQIEAHNAMDGRNFDLAHNMFSDWSPVEYNQMLGYRPSMHMPRRYQEFEETNGGYVDWVSAGAVTAVKD